MFSSFHVAFAPGPIGLQLEPGSPSSRACVVVQRVVPHGVASQQNKIQTGDSIHKVNGRRVTSYEQAIRWLKVDGTRDIEFVRYFATTNNDDVALLDDDVAAASPSLSPSPEGGVIVDDKGITSSNVRNDTRRRRSSSTSNKKVRARGHSVPGVVRRIVVAPPPHPPTADPAASPSSTTTFDTTHRRSRVSQTPPAMRATPPPPRTRSLDPPSSLSRHNNTCTTTDPALPRLDLTMTPLAGKMPPSPPASRRPASFFAALAPRQWRTSAITTDGKDPSPPTAAMATEQTTSSSSSRSPPSTEPRIRVMQLQAELQQERANTHILQQNKIEWHRCRRELEIWHDRADQSAKEVDDLKSENLLLQQQLQQQQQGQQRRSADEETQLLAANAAVQQQLEAVQEQLNVSRQELLQSRAEAQELQTQLQSQIESERERWSVQVDELRAAFEAEREQSQALHESDLQAAIASEAERWQSELAEAVAHERQLQSPSLRQYETDLKQQRSESEQFAAQRDDFQAKLERQEQEHHQAESQHKVELEQRRLENDRLQGELERLRGTMEVKVQEWTRSSESHQAEIQSLRSERDQFEAALGNSREIWDQQTRQQQQTIDRLGAELEVIIAEKVQLRCELDSLRLDLHNTKQLDDDKALSRLEMELEATRREKQELQNGFEEARANQEQKLNRAEARFEVELECAQLENERLLAQLCDRQALADLKNTDDSAGLLEELRERNVELHQLRQQAITLQMSVHDLEAEVKVKETACQVATMTIQEMQATKSNYARNVTRLTSIVDEMAAEKLRLQEKLYSTQDKLALATEQHAAKVKSLESNGDNLQEKVQSLTRDLQVTREKSLTLERHNQSLELQLQKLRDDLDQSVQASKERSDVLMREKEKELSLVKTQLTELDVERRELFDQLESAKRDHASALEEMGDLDSHHRNYVEKEKQRTMELEERIKAKYQEDSDAVNSKFSRASFEVAELRRALHVLESTKESLASQKNSLSLSNTELASKVSELQRRLEERDSDLSMKAIDITAAEGQIEDLREDLSSKAMELVSCQQSIESLQAQCSQLNHCLSKLVDESSKDRESLVQNLLAVQDELDESKKACGHLQKLLESMRRSAAESETRYAQVRELLERERGNVQYILHATEESRGDLREQLNCATTKIANLEATTRKLEEERVVMQAQSEELRKHREAMNLELIMAKSDAQAANAALSSEKQSYLESLSSERVRGDELAEKLRLANARIDEQQREHGIASSRLEEKIRMSLSEAESKRKSFEEMLKSKEAELQGFYGCKEELKSARSEVSRLGASLRRSKEEIDHLSTTMDGLRQQQNSRLDQMLGSHRREQELAAHEKQELERLLRRSEGKLESLESKLLAVEEGLAASQMERERVIAEKHDLLAALQTAEQRVAELVQELQAAQNEDMISSVDCGEFEFSGMSKVDLRARCVRFREELSDLQQQVENFAALDAQRAEDTARVQSDLVLMSAEVDNLMKTNGMLESRLASLRTLHDEAVETERSARSETMRTKELVKSLELRVLQESRRADSMKEQVLSLEEERVQMVEDRITLVDAHKTRINEVEKLLAIAESGRRSSVEDLSRNQADLNALKLESDAMREKILSLESEVTIARDELRSTAMHAKTCQTEKSSEIEILATQVLNLERECSALRQSSAKLEAQLEESKIELKCRIDNEDVLSLAVDKARQELDEMETMREDVVSKLAQASNVVASQKHTIDALEKRSKEAEGTCDALSAQILNLHDKINELEGSTTRGAQVSVSRIRELEQTCAELETEKDDALKEAASLRDELRRAQQTVDGEEKSTASLQLRLTSIKGSLERSKGELSEKQAELRESNALSRRLEGELESRRMEGDHYKAKIQLLNASVVRLQSDVMLYKEAALQAEFRLSAAESMDEEISRLQSQIRSKDSKLEQLTEVYRSQEQVLALSQTLEEQLITFIEELIQRVDDACGEVSSQRSSTIFLHVASKLELRALDLAGVEDRSPKASTSQSRKLYVTIIQTIIGELEAKRRQLCSWKKQRARRVLSIVTTPSTKNRETVPETPEVVETLNNVKRVLNEHLSPIKQHGMNRLDVEYFQKVIHALERNIDSLLDDLKSANDSLKAKDQLFADLEHLASHREWERSRLEKKLESHSAVVRDLEDKLKLQVSWKRAADKELATLRKKLDSHSRHSDGPANSGATVKRTTAGRLIANFVESRTKHKPSARTFCHKGCQTEAPQVVEQQLQAATELSQQLDSTRQKLSQLKQQMRRRREPSMDCIVEGYESL